MIQLLCVVYWLRRIFWLIVTTAAYKAADRGPKLKIVKANESVEVIPL
jgi:hypothetical protein